MTKISNLGLLTLLASSALACSVDRTQSVSTGYYFTGWVYDGVSNDRLGDTEDDEYRIWASFGRETHEGSVNPETGRFWLGPIEPFHDYTISIDAGENYRPFYASQSFLVGAARGANGQQSQLFEAFVFPSPDVLPSPPLTFTIQTPDGTLPNGKIRVTPNNDVGESVLNLQGDIEGSVDGQVWENDADRKFATVLADVEDGVVSFAEGALVYGVEYEATVFAAEGYTLQSFTFRSGVTDDQTVVLPRLTEQALAIVSNSTLTDEDGLDENATIVLTFNQEIELSSLFTLESVIESIDDGFSIVSPDADGDGESNALIISDDEDDVQERGVSFEISGNTLTFTWERDESNFETQDEDDPIARATYDVSSIRLKPAGARIEREVTLDSLLGGALAVQVDPVDAL
jgi:hypothetical protein